MDEKQAAAAHEARGFPRWEELYGEKPVEDMPWYNPELDADVAAALEALDLRGGRVLDIGTGPGTQAIHLARRGFDVTATDLSADAVRLARERAEAEGVAVTWKQDDVLASTVTGPFDLVLDRGCFHVLPPERRADYVATVFALLAPGGHLFLKVFSREQPGEEGPYRFRPEEVTAIFGDTFEVESWRESEYQGTRTPRPRTLFCVLRRPG